MNIDIGLDPSAYLGYSISVSHFGALSSPNRIGGVVLVLFYYVGLKFEPLEVIIPIGGVFDE